MTDAVRLGRRLADLRRARDAAARAGPSAAPAPGSADPRVPAVEAGAVRAELARRTEGLARRLAEAVDGEWIRGAAGGYVRVERPSVALPGRPGAAGRPAGQRAARTSRSSVSTPRRPVWPPGPAPSRSWSESATWVGRSVPAGPAAVARPRRGAGPARLRWPTDPADAWLVTYNGRGFDWPLLVARYRMSRRAATGPRRPSRPAAVRPADLPPSVDGRPAADRRDRAARVSTRGHDVEGWEIPGRYLDFLRGGAGRAADRGHPPQPRRRPVAGPSPRARGDHARSLGRPADRPGRRPGRAGPGLPPARPGGGCARLSRRRPRGRSDASDHSRARSVMDGDPHHPGRCVRPNRRPRSPARQPRTDRRTAPARLDRDELLVDRARLLRRLGRHDDALDAWRDLALGGGRWAGVAWIEVAKILEHRQRDPVGALEACGRADRIAERARFIGQRTTGLELDLARRRRRLLRRVASAGGRASRGIRPAAGVPAARVAVALASAVGSSRA